MDISSISNLYKTTADQTSSIRSTSNSNSNDFSQVLNSMISMVDETNTYQNTAESEQIKFALGESDNTHDLAIAQQKANVALQYTVAVRDKFISAYQEIMNIQI